MAGPSDISTILSQAGRIEKINNNPFVHSEVARQVLTEDEVRERLKRNREVNAAKKGQDIQTDDRKSGRDKSRRKGEAAANGKETAEAEPPETDIKHIIDVVI